MDECVDGWVVVKYLLRLQFKTLQQSKSCVGDWVDGWVLKPF